MYLICGLGNPGREYNGTRHNVGFEAVDIIADRMDISCTSLQGKSLVGSGFFHGIKVILMKPLTYMNLSGEAVQEIVHYYKIDPADVIVISDDIDIAAGALRIRKKGSAGGHNGLKNIILHLGTEDFPRIRIGVGAKPTKDANLANHVLGRPGGEDAAAIDEAKEKAALAVEMILLEGLQPAMNAYNTKKEKKEKKKDKKEALTAETAQDAMTSAAEPANTSEE